MNSYIYKEIKHYVTMTDVLEKYGYSVNKGLALCPFHNEKTPSLKVYSDNFYCYGCGEGGDLVKFVSRLFNVKNYEAAKIINSDFGLGLNVDEKSSFRVMMKYETDIKEKKRLDNHREHAIKVLSDYRGYLWQIRKSKNIGTPEWFESLRNLDRMDYYINCCLTNFEDFEKCNRKVVIAIEQGRYDNRRIS